MSPHRHSGNARARHHNSRDRGSSLVRGERSGEGVERVDHPEAPDVSGVYRGTIKNTARHGAYVELAGFRGRVEGMVHISNLSNRRVNDVTDVCKRGDEVWVKVLSIQPPQPGQPRQRIDLSLRDVDQGTGQDLLPVHDTALNPIGVPLICSPRHLRPPGHAHLACFRARLSRGALVHWWSVLQAPACVDCLA